MKDIIRTLVLTITALCASASLMAMEGDDPLLFMAKLDRFEKAYGEEDSAFVFEGETWMGHDLHKIWLKMDADRENGETGEAELQLLYSQAVTSFWDFQIGVRADIEPSPKRHWAVIGWQGLAPYFLETEASLFVAESGLLALRLAAEYELLITQKLILSPELELNFYSQDDQALQIGSGLSDAELGLRLRYEIRREFAPYIGINWKGRSGRTAELFEASGQPVEDTQVVLGVRAWF